MIKLPSNPQLDTYSENFGQYGPSRQIFCICIADILYLYCNWYGITVGVALSKVPRGLYHITVKQILKTRFFFLTSYTCKENLETNQKILFHTTEGLFGVSCRIFSFSHTSWLLKKNIQLLLTSQVWIKPIQYNFFPIFFALNDLQ